MTSKDKIKLEKLNNAADRALKARKEWMDEKMAEYAKVKVGEDIYNLKTGQKLGTVTRYYRYHANQNPLYDKIMKIDYEYETSPNCFDNTSRQIGLSFGTKEDAVRVSAENTYRLTR